MKKSLHSLVSLCLLLVASIALQAQVTIMPTSIFIHDAMGVESLNISNYSETPQEVRISFEFSYAGYDSLGNLVMVDHDTTTAERYGLGDYVRAFPRSFVLQPKSQQLVRVQVKPMRDKTDGTYWTRMIISSNAPAKDIETVQMAEGVGTRINYIFNQNIPVFYKKGKVSTGLQIASVDAQLGNEQLDVVARLIPQGNSPYNGSVQARIVDEKGDLVAEKETNTVVYFEALRRVEIPLPEAGLPSGNYQVELLYQTQRRDIGTKELVQTEPVRYNFPLNVK